MELRIGARAEVLRVNHEPRRGYVLERVECLRHIGDFYLVGDMVSAEGPERKGGRPRKGEGRPARKRIRRPFGMYAAEDITLIPGRPMKEE